jgi:hypothetical protein
MRKMRNAYDVFIGEPVGKRPLRRCRHRCEGNIRMDLREVEWEGVHWIHQTQDRDQWQAVVITVMNLTGSIKGREFLE